MLHDVVKDVFDQALVDLSDRALPKLAIPGGDCEPAVTHALEELTKLSGPKPGQSLSDSDFPAYHLSSVGLLYLQWYQAQQVNVAYSIIRPAIATCGPSLWPSGSASLHVVDFGCGAFAVGLGLALALSTLVESGRPIPAVTITGIDYPSMLDLGQQLWLRVLDRAKQQAHLGSFRTALEAITLRRITMSQFPSTETNVSRASHDRVWLTAFHVAYESKVASTSRSLRFLADALRPDAGILTVPSTKHYLVTAISPFAVPSFEQQSITASFLLNGNLPKITNWRKSLRRRSPLGYETHGGLLMSDVTWQGEEQGKRPTFGLYLKRQQE